MLGSKTLGFALIALWGLGLPQVAVADEEAPPWERDDEEEDPDEPDGGGDDGEGDEDEDDEGPDGDGDEDGEDWDYEEDEDEDEYEEDEDEDEDERRADETRRAADEDGPTDPVAKYRAGEFRLERNRSGEDYPNAFAAAFRVRAPWSVRRGDGTLVPPLKIARLFGDKETANKVIGHQIGGISAGGGVFVLGASLLIGGGAAVGAQRGDTRDGRGRVDAATANRLLTAGAILGPILMITGASVTIGLIRRTRQVAWYYDRDDAEDAVYDANEALREELGLSRRDLRGSARTPTPPTVAFLVGPGTFGAVLTW